ncbi:hypothetical protein [Pseudobutyrivibrio ruminis]|uniref:Uncharacterized protein n=1 Tax=Pseudobutyrivibrio ruminis TaxID=46206 RepID=A0A2G3DYJ6_9FIRM|nr:hypothetical protein [Pseudobutyrivibrio ruminis]PHU36031.1 hypothetical protein CSX01_02000 [Pseudobutyrivibrio ruminis]
MGDYYQMTISDWLASKTEEIRQELGKTAQSFVAIGYKLKEVRDSGNLGEGETIADYAQREFGLSASTTSRFIAINEKFGDGLELKSEYLKFGSGKLQEMLALTDADCELINHNHTVSQIREIKRFEAEKHEDVPKQTEEQWGAFEKCLIDFFKDKKQLLTDICEAEYYDTEDYKKAADLISPNGSTTHKKGVVFMFMYQFDEGIKYKIFGEQAARRMSYVEFISTIRHIFDCEKGVNPHEAFYGVEKEPETVEKSTNIPIATSQVEEVTENVSEEDENKNFISETEDEAEADGDNGEHIVEAGEQATVQGIQDRSEEKNDNDSYDSEEVEDETDNGNPGEDDYSNEAENDEVEHVEVAAVEDFAEAEAEALANDIEMDADPRHELIDSLEYYCKELVEASKWPTYRAAAYRDRSDELIDLILSTRKDILMMNFKIESEKEEDEGE